jgi:hypothetical protein
MKTKAASKNKAFFTSMDHPDLKIIYFLFNNSRPIQHPNPEAKNKNKVE